MPEKTIEQLNDYISTLPEAIGKPNAKLIEDYAKRYAALPTKDKKGISFSRIRTVCTRLKTISLLLNNKSLNALNEKDLIALNNKMRQKEMASAPDYRKALSRFLRLTDRRKHAELLASDFLKSGGGSTGSPNPDTFWSQLQLDEYLKEAKRHSKKYFSFSGILISCALRPHEAIALPYGSIIYSKEARTITVKVPEQCKTGGRKIILQGSEALGLIEILEPYLAEFKEKPASELLFPGKEVYCSMHYIHERLCDKINLPKEKSRKFYIFRKMGLSRFYQELGVVKGALQSGHVPGSRSAQVYLAMSDDQREGLALTSIRKRECPSCSLALELEQSTCPKCGSPADKKQFQDLMHKNFDALIDTKLELFKAEFKLATMKLKKN